LKQLAAEAGNDPSLLWESAVGYLKLADALGRPAFSNLGDYQGALEGYLKGREIVERLLEIDPTHEKGLGVLAVTYEREAAVLKSQFQFEEALLQFEKAIACARRLHELNPENEQAQMLQMFIPCTMAELEIDRVDPEAAWNYLQSSELAELLNDETPVDQLPADLDLLRTRAVLHSTAGRIFVQRNESEKALSQFRRAIAVGIRISQLAPDNAIFQADMCFRQEQVGLSLLKLNRVDEAADAFRRAYEIASSQVERDPVDHRSRLTLVRLMGRLAELHLRLGQWEQAEPHATNAVELMRRLMDDMPSDQKRLNAYAQSTRLAAKVAAERGRKGEAAGRFDESSELYLQLHEAGSKATAMGVMAADGWIKSALLHGELDEYDESKPRILRAIRMLETLLETSPDDKRLWRLLSTAQDYMARTCSHLCRQNGGEGPDCDEAAAWQSASGDSVKNLADRSGHDDR
jgi:tetratricopeptide (TPR) repeat protein